MLMIPIAMAIPHDTFDDVRWYQLVLLAIIIISWLSAMDDGKGNRK